MAVEEIVSNVSPQAVSNFILELGRIGLWLQAFGVLIIFWIIFQLISLWVNRKSQKTLFLIKKDLKRIEHKIDLLRKK